VYQVEWCCLFNIGRYSFLIIPDLRYSCVFAFTISLCRDFEFILNPIPPVLYCEVFLDKRNQELKDCRIKFVYEKRRKNI